jgi:hypothetical protein
VSRYLAEPYSASLDLKADHIDLTLFLRLGAIDDEIAFLSVAEVCADQALAHVKGSSHLSSF